MKDNLSEVILILDKSSSMLGTRDDTLRGVNTFIEEQKALPGEANFTLVTFGTHGENTKLYKGKNIKKVKSVTKEDYKPNGNTALYDAIALTIDEMGANLAKLEEKNRPANVIITIMTDGHENDSRQFSLTQVQEKIKHQSEVYNWKFIFLGASLDAVEIGKSL